MKGDRWKATQLRTEYIAVSGWGWITGEEPELTGYDPTKDANIIENSEYRFVLGYACCSQSYNFDPPGMVLLELPSLLTDIEIQQQLDDWNDGAHPPLAMPFSISGGTLFLITGWC